MSLLAEHVPKYRRELVRLKVETHFAGTFENEIQRLADFRYARQIALDIGREDGHARARKTLRDHLQGYRLTGSGRTGDQAMAIGERKREPGGFFALADEDLVASISHLVVGCSHSPRLFSTCPAL